MPDGIAIDLGTRNWTAAVVTAGSWVVRPHPVRFRRPPTLAPLPVPVLGGDLTVLHGLLNVRHEDDHGSSWGSSLALCARRDHTPRSACRGNRVVPSP